jgi:ABC-type nitrate/sulfonate/bicarbonate transport system substrate-binding protein
MRLLQRAGLALVSLALVACGSAATPPASQAPSLAPGGPSAAPSTAQSAAPSFAPAKVIVAQTSLSAVQWPYFVALDQGLYERFALDVQFVTADSNANAIQGILAGSVNIGGGSLSSLIQAIANGSTNLIVTAAAVDRPLYPLVVAGDVQSFADLKGHRVGVSRVASTDGTWMRQILEKNGLNPDSDVEIVEVGGTSQRYQALVSGGVDAVFITQPLDFQAHAKGFRDLGSSRDLTPQLVWESFATTRDWAEANTDVLVRFLAAHRLANQWLYDPANRDAAIALLVSQTKADPADAAQTYDLWVKEQVFAKDSVALPEAVKASIDLETKLKTPVTVDAVLESSYMDQAALLAP